VSLRVLYDPPTAFFVLLLLLLACVCVQYLTSHFYSRPAFHLDEYTLTSHYLNSACTLRGVALNHTPVR